MVCNPAMNPHKTPILGAKEEKIQSARDKLIYEDKRVFQFVSKRAARFVVRTCQRLIILAFGIWNSVLLYSISSLCQTRLETS